MMISTVRGEFKRFSGAVDFNEAEPTSSSVVIEIDASSMVCPPIPAIRQVVRAAA
jgi:polyisoprenoid-binding protein YceI